MKVTLATLSQASAQDVFDTVVRGLAGQGFMKSAQRQPNGAYLCAYRGANGRKCAAGHLIADDEYRPRWEGKCWVLMPEDANISSNHQSLIGLLQDAHDGGFDPQRMVRNLQEVAGIFLLNWPADVPTDLASTPEQEGAE